MSRTKDPNDHFGPTSQVGSSRRASISTSVAENVNLESESLPETIWDNEGPSTYELLKREGELHQGRGTVIDELRKNVARLEDLNNQLLFMMKEVESVLRR